MGNLKEFEEKEKDASSVEVTVIQVSSPGSIISTRSASTNDMTKASWKIKVLVVICMLILPVGCHYMEATMGTLKTTLKKNMNIDNTQFGILLSAVTLVNTVLPLLAGAFIDDTAGFGSIRATIFVSVVIFFGALVVSLAASHNNYPAMVTGQMIYGLGGGMIVTMQEAIISKWFRNQHLSIVIGVALCTARLGKWIAKMICYPIVNATGNTNIPIYIATVICAIAVFMNCVYWYVMYYNGWATSTGKELSSPSHVINYHLHPAQQTKDDKLVDETTPPVTSLMTPIRWILRWLPYLPPIFWMVPWIQFVFSSVLSSFEDIATEYVQFRHHTTNVMAGYQSSLTQIAPVVIAPIMGGLIHRYGQRVTSLVVGTLFLILSIILMDYTMVSPAAGMILFSCAIAFGPVCIMTASALLLPYELAGIGMGIHRCANNIGTTIVAVMVGYVQDWTVRNGHAQNDQVDLQNEYNGVMTLYLTLACCSTVAAFILWYMDYRLLDGWLQVNKKERDRRLAVFKSSATLHEQPQQQQQDEEHPDTTKKCSDLAAIGSHVLQKKSYVYVGIYTFWLVAAWVVFFVFALMPIYMHYEHHQR